MSVQTQQKNHGKTIFIILAVVATILFTVIYFGIIRPQQMTTANSIKINGVYLPTPKTISDFQLTDNHGKPYTQENLKGHWTMMFFGFSNCAMVCPVTMSALNNMYLKLEKDLPANELPQVVMVSVDPDRDTVERMNDYVSSFNSHFIGARAEIEATVALEKQLNIAAAKIQSDGAGKNNYTINHSAEILVFNPNGKLQAYLSYPHDPAQMAQDYKAMLKTVS